MKKILDLTLNLPLMKKALIGGMVYSTDQCPPICSVLPLEILSAPYLRAGAYVITIFLEILYIVFLLIYLQKKVFFLVTDY